MTTSDSATDAETSDLLCVLLADLLYKYSYNDKYAALIAVRLEGPCNA